MKVLNWFVLFAVVSGGGVVSQAATEFGLVCDYPTIIETQKYGPVAFKLSGGFSRDPKGFVGQRIGVVSANAFKAKANAVGEENPVTVLQVDKLDGAGRLAVIVQLGTGTTAYSPTAWFVCEMHTRTGEMK